MAKMKLIERVNGNGSTRWLHCSEGDGHYILRDFRQDPERVDKANLDADVSSQRFVPLADVAPWVRERVGHRLSRLSVTRDAEQWREVLVALEERERGEDDEVPARSIDSPLVVPKTSLRQLYELLRDVPALEGHSQICAHAWRGEDAETTLLDELFASSVHELEPYSRASEPFHTRKTPAWRADFRSQPSRFAHWVVAQVAPEFVNWFEVENVPARLRAVDYEIFTLRTAAGAVFPDGTQVRSGGSGGLDLLLDWEGTPVVAEVKAKRDTNAFLSLVQALVYAAELSTPAQIRRLRSWYPKNFGSLEERDRLGIAIICEGSPKLLSEAKELAGQLMAIPHGPIAERVRFTAFIHGTADHSNRLCLSLDALF